MDPQTNPKLQVALNLDDICRNTKPRLSHLQIFHGPDNHMYVFEKKCLLTEMVRPSGNMHNYFASTINTLVEDRVP